MRKFEILYKQEYIGRIIFAIKIQDKITFVYKSSGFSGTGHGGDIIPFMYLNTRRTISSPIIGYIWKEYLVNGRYQSHSKNFYGKEKEFLLELKEFLKDEVITQTEQEMEAILESPEFPVFVTEINEDLRNLEKEYGLFDYGMYN